GDLNDFLSPASECVLPLKAIDTFKKSEGSRKDPKNRSEVVASVSLSDCLSCSGCVTSAEEVMMKRQGVDHLTKAVEVGSTCVVSFSPQSLSSLAACFNTTASKFARSVSSFLKLRVGVKFVFDTSLSAQVAQHEAKKEFMERWGARGPFPILCTECPGVVIFSEKKQYDLFARLLSTVRSPQAISGERTYLFSSLNPFDMSTGKLIKQIWHCTIMPCFDKKLESAREEFSVVETEGGALTSSPETDAVITTSEFYSYLLQEGFQFQGGKESNVGRKFKLPSMSEPQLSDHSAGFSNGYLEVVARHAAQQILGINLPPSLVYNYPATGSLDIKELTVSDGSGRELNFAAVYGYRHLQTLIQKVRMRQCKYHYVELMSCPEGCTNGGGQLK
ncbi:hypothetical protein GUITHDRAFT_42060, partial [Guillardia theta CCMP2712]